MIRRALVVLILLAAPAFAGAAELPFKPVPSYSPETQALREAVALQKEGDRLQAAGQPGDARASWLAALQAYERAGFSPGRAEVFFRIAGTYQIEATLDPQKQSLAIVNMARGLLAGVEVFLEGLTQEVSGDRDAVQKGDALFAEASKLVAAGECEEALPLFVKAGEIYGNAGWGTGEANGMAERLRCFIKTPNSLGLVIVTGETMNLFEKLKPRLRVGPSKHHLVAISLEESGNRKEAEEQYRKTLAGAGEDPEAAGRAALDLGGLLAREGNLKEARKLFASAREQLAALPGGRDLWNETAAIHNLGGLDLVEGRVDKAIAAFRGSAETWKTLGEKAREAEALRALSSALRKKGDGVSAAAALAEADKLEEGQRAAGVSDQNPGTAGEHQEQNAAQEPGNLSPPTLPPPSLPADGVILTLSPRAQAQREATLLLGEGDRLAQAGNLRTAREKWLASAEAFRRAANRQGVAKCYKQLGDSYAAEIVFDQQKILLSSEYYIRAMTELARDVEESLKRNKSLPNVEDLQRARKLIDKAASFVDLKDCKKALPLIDEARSLYQRVHLSYGEALALGLRGRCEALRGDLRSALMTSMESVQVLAALPVETPLSELALKAGELFTLGKQKDALALYQEVLHRYEEAEDVAGMIGALRDLGGAQSTLGDFAAAEIHLSRALSLLPSVSEEVSQWDEATVHQNMGAVYVATGRFNEAITELKAALSIWREMGELTWEVATLSALGVALSNKGDFSAALAALGEAEKLQGKISPNLELQGDLLNNRGTVYRSQGRYQEALDSFNQAAALYQQLPVRLKEAQTLSNIGAIQEAQGQFAPALSNFERAKEIAHRLGAAGLETKVEFNIANVFFESEKYQPAISAYLEILDKAEGNPDRQMIAGIHANLGAAFLRIGDAGRASEYLERAVKMAEAAGVPEGTANAYSNLGQLMSHVGQTAKAESMTRKSLGIWRELGNEVMANRVLGNLGWQTSSRKASEEDLQAFQRGLESSRKAGQTMDAVRFSLLISALYLDRGDHAKVSEYAGQAIAEADSIGDSAGQYVGRSLLMVSHFQQGNLTAALGDLDAAVTGLDEWQRRLTLSEFKGTFLAQFFDIYAYGVLLNAETGKSAEAFSYAEQARARVFRDQIGNQRIETRRGTEPELVEQEGDLRARLAFLDEAVRKEAREELRTELKKVRDKARADYATLLTRLKLANPEHAALVSVSTLSLQEVQQKVLDEHTTLIEYFVPDSPGSQGSSTKILAWVIDRQQAMTVWLPVSPSDLENKIENFRLLIAGKDSVQLQGAELYRKIFAPLAPHVRHRNVVIVPHGVLHYLPFAALWDPTRQQYLGDAYALSYSPSATVLRFAREKKAQAVGPVLVAGNPDGSLPDAALEAGTVARLHGGEPLLGRAASEGAVVAEAEKAGILHLAAHAELNTINPLFTRIKLAASEGKDGNLEMHEVFGLDLSKTGLVVLSACSTQMGRLTAGDEIEGLTRAFLYAGTPAVMSSLWKVADESTSFLMERFYTQLRKGEGRAEALRKAQKETRKRFPHPYHWAAFVLTGDGR